MIFVSVNNTTNDNAEEANTIINTILSSPSKIVLIADRTIYAVITFIFFELSVITIFIGTVSVPREE
ncbi:hypothetical protein SCA04_20430 [Staphylococcus carnosus]|nr:hypothetical protein SCA04_20430 [Staphylococcus carnosus]